MIFIHKGEKNKSGGRRDRENSNSLKWKGQALFLSQKMSSMADCCSSEDKDKNPFRVTSGPKQRTFPGQRTPGLQLLAPSFSKQDQLSKGWYSVQDSECRKEKGCRMKCLTSDSQCVRSKFLEHNNIFPPYERCLNGDQMQYTLKYQVSRG